MLRKDSRTGEPARPDNHIIFCAVDFAEHKKYISNRKSYAQIRRVSDRLCRENGLSIPPPTKYLRGREREIILFEASARALKAAGIGDKLPDLAKLREEYSKLSEEKDRLYAEYGSLKKRMREYDAVKQNIDSIIFPNRGQEQDKAL